MRKNIILIICSIICLVILLGILSVVIFKPSVDVYESPDGDYEIISICIDKGGWGYGGAFYLREKGLFSPWHKIADQPAMVEWISDDVFSVTEGSASGLTQPVEYHVSDFID